MNKPEKIVSVIRKKPNTRIAMAQLIDEVRTAIPFDISEDALCSGTCRGCPKKLLEYLDTELSSWTERLTDSEHPKLGDLDALGKTSKKIYRALKKNQIV